jgi:hypothetical protein
MKPEDCPGQYDFMNEACTECKHQECENGSGSSDGHNNGVN